MMGMTKSKGKPRKCGALLSVTRTVMLTEAMDEEIKAEAKRRKCYTSDLVRRYIQEGLDRDKSR